MHAEVVADCQAVLGESALWHAESQRLYWLDLARPTLYSLDPLTGQTGGRALSGRAPLGALAASALAGHVVLVKREGVHLLELLTGEEHRVADPLRGREGFAYNDAGVDAAGRLWVGSLEESETEATAEMFVVEADGSFTSAAQGFVVCNGPAFSPDGLRVYVSDTTAGTVRVYDLSPEGRPVNPRVFARVGEDSGLPDGLATDAEGGLWVAHWGGGRVSRWDPDGELVAEIRIPTPNVTSVAFGGADLSRLFVTTAEDPYGGSGRRAPSGALFAVEPGVAGVPVCAWAGRA